MPPIPDDDIILQEFSRERPVRSVFWAFFFLAVAAVVAIAQRDAAFVIIAGMGLAVLLAVTRPMERLNKWLYRLIRVFALLCLVYEIVAIAAFDFLRSFPTCSLWYQIGGWNAPLLDLLSHRLELVLASSIVGYVIVVA